MFCLSLLRFAALVALVVPLAASPVQFGFYGITSNGSDVSAVGQQLVMSVSDESSTTVGFTFTNVGNVASSITDIYFDDAEGAAALLAAVNPSITVGSAASFSQNASPGNLPGGNNATPPFVASDVSGVEFSADSDSGPGGVKNNGANNSLTPFLDGEWVKITWTLATSKTYSDVLTALNNASLRVGLHVQGMPNDESNSYINTPEPGFYGLLSLCLGGLALFRRRLRPSNPLG